MKKPGGSTAITQPVPHQTKHSQTRYDGFNDHETTTRSVGDLRVKTVEILITGRVQRVGFRACVRRIATDLHVAGTVMNLSDGRVQIFATSDPMILEKFISMLYGCPRAIIRDLRTTDTPLRIFDEFSIIRHEGRISTSL